MRCVRWSAHSKIPRCSTARKAKVDKLYKKAIELGAKDEGPAGPRGCNFYAGYFRDLDGNKLNFFCMSERYMG